MRIKRLVLTLACTLALSSCGKKDAEDFAVKPDAATVKELAAAAHQALTAPITDLSVLPPGATPPPPVENLTLIEEDQVLAAQRGIISAYADWCGFDWEEQSFTAFLAGEAFKRRLSDAQMDYLALIHTLAFQKYSAALARAGAPCTEKDRAMVKPHLYKDSTGAIPDADKYPSE